MGPLVLDDACPEFVQFDPPQPYHRRPPLSEMVVMTNFFGARE